MKVAEEFEGPQIGFLHQIFRIMVIARQPPRQIVGRIHVRHDDFLEPSECMLIRLLPFFPHMKTAFPGGLFPWRCSKGSRRRFLDWLGASAESESTSNHGTSKFV